MDRGWCARACGALAVSSALMSMAAMAVTAHAADFFQGKQLRLISGSDAGGGYDAYARLLARHWSDFIPGHPTIVVQNMPGASSMKALNEIANNAPKDGTEVAGVQNNIAFEPLLNISGESANAKFDPLKLNWVGASTKDTTIGLVWKDSKVKTIQDAMKIQINTGASGPATSTSITARIIDAALGTKFNVINGYKSQSQMNLAIERGEVDGVIGIQYVSIASTKPDWIADKKINIIVQVGQEKHPNLPNVPLLRDLIADPGMKQQIDLAFASLSMGRPFVAPAGMAADRIKLLRDTFMDAFNSKALHADAAKLKLEVIPMRGEDVSKLLADAYASPKPVVDKVKAMLAGKN
jgi:tripartite-type tricarboxylate transporter receptor subunit TctC